MCRDSMDWHVWWELRPWRWGFVIQNWLKEPQPQGIWKHFALQENTSLDTARILEQALFKGNSQIWEWVASAESLCHLISHHWERFLLPSFPSPNLFLILSYLFSPYFLFVIFSPSWYTLLISPLSCFLHHFTRWVHELRKHLYVF